MDDYVKARIEVEKSDIKISTLAKELAENCFKIRDELGKINVDMDEEDSGSGSSGNSDGSSDSGTKKGENK